MSDKKNKVEFARNSTYVSRPNRGKTWRKGYFLSQNDVHG